MEGDGGGARMDVMPLGFDVCKKSYPEEPMVIKYPTDNIAR